MLKHIRSWLICLSNRKLSQPVEESAFIYQIFGGKFRSQLKCNSCYATSNNYEACLDLSLDLNSRINTIQQALANYTKVDIIGSDDDPSNKYKCEL
jgi:ubiquitin C-terminal hydrolase